MKKLVIKTIALTAVILLVLSAGFYLVLSCLFPSQLADFYFKSGNEKLALKYSEKAYDKSSDVLDLAILAERSIAFDDNAKIITYCSQLINDENYHKIFTSKGQSYHYYIVGSLCQARYEKGDKSVAVETAFSNTSDYVEHNPIHRLIVLSASKNDQNTLAIIKQKLIERQEKNQLLESHLALINQLIN